MFRVQKSPAVVRPDVSADQVWSTSLSHMDTVAHSSSSEPLLNCPLTRFDCLLRLQQYWKFRFWWILLFLSFILTPLFQGSAQFHPQISSLRGPASLFGSFSQNNRDKTKQIGFPAVFPNRGYSIITHLETKWRVDVWIKGKWLSSWPLSTLFLTVESCLCQEMTPRLSHTDGRDEANDAARHGWLWFTR